MKLIGQEARTTAGESPQVKNEDLHRDLRWGFL